jgi:hypothetical protein
VSTQLLGSSLSRGITGKITGNFEKNAPPGDFHFEINKRFQLFAAKIPYATSEAYQGKFFKEQGIFTPDRQMLRF